MHVRIILDVKGNRLQKMSLDKLSFRGQLNHVRTISRRSIGYGRAYRRDSPFTKLALRYQPDLRLATTTGLGDDHAEQALPRAEAIPHAPDSRQIDPLPFLRLRLYPVI